MHIYTHEQTHKHIYIEREERETERVSQIFFQRVAQDDIPDNSG